ncbi:ribonuclease III [Cadophora sp. DSE1049]|nr:ribonuclease III [Cadophora sp. DSE1049]
MTRSANRAANRRKAASAAALAALSPEQQHDLEQKLGHVFADRTILLEALQAAGNGVHQLGERKIEDGNKRLAMVGDSILQLAVLMDWFEEGESRQSGHYTLVSIASNRNLNDCGQANGLSNFINKGRQFANGEIPPRTMSATVEALIGAVFMDSGESLEAVKVAMRGLGLL